MKPINFKHLLVACTLMLGLAAYSQPITKPVELEPQNAEMPASLPQTAVKGSMPMQLCDGALCGADGLVTTPAKAPLKAPLKADDVQDEWTYFGTAEFNDAFYDELANDLLLTLERKPIDVYFKRYSEYLWKFRFVGLFGVDVDMDVTLNQGSSNIAPTSTACDNYFAGQGDQYLPTYAIKANLLGTPFQKEMEFKYFLFATETSGWNMGGDGATVTFHTDGYEHFGTATANDRMIEQLPAYGIECSDAACDVSYKKLDSDVYAYKVAGMFGAGSEYTILEYTGAHHSVIVCSPTASPNPYYEGNKNEFKTYHVGGYVSYSPRDGVMSFPVWMFIRPGYGYSFTGSYFAVTFESELLSTFRILGDVNRYGRPDETAAVFEVERSANVQYAAVRVEYIRYDQDRGSSDGEVLFDDLLPIADDNTISYPLTEGRGYYYFIILGVDNVGRFGTTGRVNYFSNMDDGHQWTSLGKGLIKPFYMKGCWPNSVAPWLEVEIQQADDVTDLYRAVNPFHWQEVRDFYSGRYEINDDMDFYLYFGSGCDYSVFQSFGINVWIEAIKSYPNGQEGVYTLNVADIVLPGVSYIDCEWASPTQMVVSPAVSKVEYSVIPSAIAQQYRHMTTDARTWFNAMLQPVWTAVPDADGRVSFAEVRAQYDGELNLLIARMVDAGGDVPYRGYTSHLSSDENGWVAAGRADFSVFKAFFELDVALDGELRLNPFDPSIVQICNPFKALDGKMPESDWYYTDFTSDRNVYLNTSLYYLKYVYACLPNGEPERIGSEIGLNYRDTEGYFVDNPIGEKDLLHTRFGTMTNVLYRSGYTDVQIEERYVAQGNPVARRYGSLLVFPQGSAYLSAQYAFGEWRNSEDFVIRAPWDWDVDDSISFSEDLGVFEVGEDVDGVRVYLVKNGELGESLSTVISDGTIGTMLNVVEGKAELPVDEDGDYYMTAVAYRYNDNPSNILNVYQANVRLTAGIDDITADAVAAEPEYYNLQGLRLDKPEAGTVVIRRQGGKAEKIMVK